MTSSNKPTDDDVDSAVSWLSSPQHEAYFLDRLANPNWIGPLRQRGFFDHPPAPRAVEGGGVRYPRWPASQYLARMARLAPQEVAEILSQVKTGNPAVARDVLVAANTAEMPAPIAATLVPAVCEASKAGVLWVYYPNATALCLRLASDGSTDAAMALADALYGLQHPARGDHDHHWYKEGLRKVLPVLTSARPRALITRLCEWLCVAIRKRDHFDPAIDSDYSSIWRPAIEEHEQNRPYDFTSEMAGFVRQALEQAIGGSFLTLADGLAIVDSATKESGFSIFERLRTHLIKCFAEQAPDLARSVMMDREAFDRSEIKHEYATLMGQRFPMLPLENRDAWLGWIDAGPDMSDFDASFRSYARREPSDEDRQNRIRQWQFDRLHWIRDHLSGDRWDFYQQMLAERGEPLLSDLNSHHSFGRGCESPFTLDDLSSLPFGEALAKVNSWRPGPARGFSRGPEFEGAAGTFAQYVASRAAEFSAHAEMLEGCQPIYVRKFLEKMTEAIQVGEINVPAVLRLCTWVVAQPRAPDTDEKTAASKLVDKGWEWARNEVCRFVETMCKAVSGKGPRYAISDHGETISRLLMDLTPDPPMSYISDRAERENPRIYDFLTSAINSPRGKAIEALLAYARWIAEHVQREENGRTIIPNGFGVMPEVKAMLEWQIAAENASYEASAIIGTYISLTVYVRL